MPLGAWYVPGDQDAAGPLKLADLHCADDIDSRPPAIHASTLPTGIDILRRWSPGIPVRPQGWRSWRSVSVC